MKTEEEKFLKSLHFWSRLIGWLMGVMAAVALITAIIFLIRVVPVASVIAHGRYTAQVVVLDIGTLLLVLLQLIPFYDLLKSGRFARSARSGRTPSALDPAIGSFARYTRTQSIILIVTYVGAMVLIGLFLITIVQFTVKPF
ncbi:hypothetical protein [Sporolactobacillus vineae]|uniref:hypothetical protein n=1 Tax=Sporolactobacillus vineae TaxID=444463 RepID=UPI000288D290|nr:hypothetical protein [Sporolactobacillus vineae]